ncbi:MAG: 16S rRNA (cytosine(1402)-N(4))-methyltransferase RsmH [Anaerolineae bacterium]|nr:16S rRNA (cytosine(1402)-N(4))-methyltransferase RsmH [Anaerolineae bacterium]
MERAKHLAETQSQLDRRAGVPGSEREEEGTGIHIPVLFQIVLDGLQVRPGGRYIDATVGGGGHAAGVLEASSPDGRLLGLDRDPAAVKAAGMHLASFGERVALVHSSFSRLAEVARARSFVPVDGILFDLGLSSLQLAGSERGFAFMADGPLDMRFDPQSGGPTAADLVNGLSTGELAVLLSRYGEERHARRIAEAIVAARPLYTTAELVDVIEQVTKKRERIHPATRTFQALRVAVNDELAVLESALPQAVEILSPGGRLAVISFHSLEDRIVKRFFRQESRDCICPPEAPACTCDHRAVLRVISRKPIRPTAAEIADNPRARSSRLRIAERIG